ncbi:hypothetical protein [Acidithiobacillus ferrivorans]|uniref:hypothetical protein n=1 Tax=Acidithiobacillus ferrivorans TaxID=160808 RepID=UPI001D010B08|nr:hypothetical protein [Acidithiobacillus ferrivorans]
MRIQAGQSIILAIDLQDRLLGTLPPARRTPLLHNITRLLAGSPRAVADACASRDAEQHNPLWSGYGRRELRSPSAESVFYEWLGDAAHPAFRTLAAAWC